MNSQTRRIGKLMIGIPLVMNFPVGKKMTDKISSKIDEAGKTVTTVAVIAGVALIVASIALVIAVIKK